MFKESTKMSHHFSFNKIRKTYRSSLSKSTSNRRITRGAAALLYLENLLLLKRIIVDATCEAIVKKKKRLNKEGVKAVAKKQLQKLKR